MFQNYIQYKHICLEMIDLLVNCKSKVAYTVWRIMRYQELYTARKYCNFRAEQQAYSTVCICYLVSILKTLVTWDKD